ncbi:unnamed protein product [Closterium sp. Naga37s-1]|nr:unnamed protein product [Closterium sp. Naga37s-1]
MAAAAVLPPGRAARAVVSAMETYHDARIQFVGKVSDLAFSPQNAEAFFSLGAMQLLLPLMHDVMSSVRSAAILSLGRLANVSDTWANDIVDRNILPDLCKALAAKHRSLVASLHSFSSVSHHPRFPVSSFPSPPSPASSPLTCVFPLTPLSLVHPLPLVSGNNRHHKRAAAFAVKAVARHAGAELAAVGSSGPGSVLPVLAECLTDAMPAVRETAACALGHVAKQSREAATRVIETGAVATLIGSLHDEEVARMALSVLGDIARHSAEHATIVADGGRGEADGGAGAAEGGAIGRIVALLGSKDVKMRRQVCVCLSQIVKHSEALAIRVACAEGISRLFLCLHDSDQALRRNAAFAMREIARKSPAAADRLIHLGAIGPVIDAVLTEEGGAGSARLAVVQALGHLAGAGGEGALAIVASEGVAPLKELLIQPDVEESVRGACAWALSQIGRHSSAHVKAVADSGALIDMVTVATVDLAHAASGASNAAGGAAAASLAAVEARTRIVRALKDLVSGVGELESLDSLLQWTTLPEGVLEAVLLRIFHVLNSSSNACRSTFVQSRGFAKLQRLHEEAEARRAAANAAGGEGGAGGAACVHNGVDYNAVYDHIAMVNTFFPFEVSVTYPPEYQQRLLEKLTASMNADSSGSGSPGKKGKGKLPRLKIGKGGYLVGKGGWEEAELSPGESEEEVGKRLGMADLVGGRKPHGMAGEAGEAERSGEGEGGDAVVVEERSGESGAVLAGEGGASADSGERRGEASSEALLLEQQADGLCAAGSSMLQQGARCEAPGADVLLAFLNSRGFRQSCDAAAAGAL